MNSIVSNLSKMWTKVVNLEKTLFPTLKEELRLEELSTKEAKLIKIFSEESCGAWVEQYH